MFCIPHTVKPVAMVTKIISLFGEVVFIRWNSASKAFAGELC